MAGVIWAKDGEVIKKTGTACLQLTEGEGNRRTEIIQIYNISVQEL